MICYGICGSFCTLDKSLEQMKILSDTGEEILPVLSYNAYSTDTRFGTAESFLKKITDICKREPIHTIKDAEPIGPVIKPDIMIIAPCTGNTLAKLANGISDTPVTLAAKSHLRNNRPLILALATNDGLSGNFKNLATLYNRKNIFFVPLVQDDVMKKPFSLVAKFSLIPATIQAARNGRQLLPLFETAAD